MTASVSSLATLIFVAGAGWLTLMINLVFQAVTARPKVRVRLYQSITTQMQFPGQQFMAVPNAPAVQLPNAVTLLALYVYMTNKRRNTVHIVDYRLKIRFRDSRKWEELQRMVGAENVAKDFVMPGEHHTLTIRDFATKMIYWEHRPVEYGKPLRGWLLFFSRDPDIERYSGTIDKYRLTCVDAFGKRYVRRMSPKDYPDFTLWLDLAGVELAPNPPGP